MFNLFALVSTLIAATTVSIIEPFDGETYDGDWLTVRAIVENENEIPDSVLYTLNGGSSVLLQRLNTDWPTYMQNYQNTGFSESPAPVTSEILWTAPVTGDYHEFPTPVVVDGIVYYPQDCSGDTLYALDAATGELIWKDNVADCDDAVTVHEGRVYCPGDTLWCLDAVSGERLWFYDGANRNGGSPIVVDGSVYCEAGFGGMVSDTSIVSSVDAITGEINWTQKIPGRISSCMGLWESFLIVPTYISNEYAPLTAIDIQTGQIVWQNTESYQGYWDSSPTIINDVIYIVLYDGKSKAIDASTGSTVWESQAIFEMTPTLSYHDGFLYHPEGCLYSSSGVAAWQRGAVPHGSTAVADGVFYYGEMVPDSGSFYCIDCLNGSVIWSYETSAGFCGITSSPAVVDGVMYIAGTDWNLYAFGTELKYSFQGDLFAEVGSNELIVTSWDNGVSVASDTINFTVTGTGISLEPTRQFNLRATPNPIYANAALSFSIGESKHVSLGIYDLTGREVSNLLNQEMVSGVHFINWNGTKDDGQPVSSGLYLCRIESGGVVETTGLCVLR